MSDTEEYVPTVAQMTPNTAIVVLETIWLCRWREIVSRKVGNQYTHQKKKEKKEEDMNIVSKEKHANINGTSFSGRVQEHRGKKRILKRVLYMDPY